MKNTKNYLYHVHRNGNMDHLWYIGNKIKISPNFEGTLYTSLLEEEQKLIERYGNYDIDYIITTMEEIQLNNFVEEDMIEDFHQMLNRYYFLRREKALEEGRKLYATNTPSRLHSLFLTDRFDLYYWINRIGGNSFKYFLLELEGNLFVSSDKYFPEHTLPFDIQVEQSKEYWKPKVKKRMSNKEFLFQGDAKIIT